jgi:SpoVK/Ycf46/Vps4 family AAA+-type ATPase
MNAITPAVPDWTKIDTPVKHQGKEIVLPSDPGNMDYDDAIETIARIRDQENQEFDVREIVKAAPWDAAVAIYRAMQDIYGVVLSESIKTFFGEIKPDFLTVQTGPRDEDRIQVPAGRMSLPGVEAPIFLQLFSEGAIIQGTVRKRDRSRLIEIANRAREVLKSQSVYRGKAIRIPVDGDGDLDIDEQPEFIDLSRVAETDMIHTAETDALIKANIFSPLKNTAACRKHHIPLKRGILLEGRWGTGKSLTSRVTAKVATDNGWTFIVLDRSQGLKAAIEFARTYQPCVIFAEDIDRAGDRDEESVNDLVNTLDGVISKDMEIMVVLTTNYVEKIDRALLRPGRFDAVISIQPPDATTAERLIRAYARDLLSADVDLGPVGEIVAGQTPATIREVVERAKLGMLMEDRTSISVENLTASAVGMKHHMALLNPPEDEQTPAEAFYGAFKGMVTEAISAESFDDLATADGVTAARNSVIQHVAKLRQHSENIAPVIMAGASAAAAAADNTRKLLDAAE